MIDDKLRLYPRDPRAEAVERELIERALMNLGLLGRSIETASAVSSFRIGERFFDLVSFDPPRADAHCTIELPDAIEEIDFLGGSNVQSPDCPGCGIVLEHRGSMCKSCGYVYKPLEAYKAGLITYNHLSMDRLTGDEWKIANEIKAKREEEWKKGGGGKK